MKGLQREQEISDAKLFPGSNYVGYDLFILC